MKTLRLLRNIAALFILVAPLLVSQPGVGLSTTHHYLCMANQSGKNCTLDLTTGECTESHCVPSQPCTNIGCTRF